VTHTRACASAGEHRLTDLAAQIYMLCDTAHRLDTFCTKTQCAVDDVQREVDDLVARKLLLELDGQFLSLAVM
jgi:hypothetical protein